MKYKICLLWIICCMLTGCWSSNELNSLGLASAIAIDKQNNNYRLTVQTINPDEVAEQNRTSRTAVTTYSATEETIFEALRKLTEITPRKIYVAHLRIFVVSEEIAKEGINDVLDFISRDHELRTDFAIIVSTEDDAKSVLEIVAPLENIAADKLLSSIETAQNAWGSVQATYLDQLVEDILSEGKHPVLSGVAIKGNKEIGNQIDNVEQVRPTANLEYVGLAGFKKDKLMGWLDIDESMGYNFIADNINSTVFSIPCDEGKTVLEVLSNETKLTGKIQNGIPNINIHVETAVNIGETNCAIETTKLEYIKQLEKEASVYLENLMKSSINAAKNELQSDIFGFGSVIHRSDKKGWNKVKTTWDELFLETEEKFNIKIIVRGTGTIEDPLQSES
ncbi:Ger(x)C family spore germination protein [Gracilibacillus suaedae]|uniref:Ger(x)C family spore germination protein n=1 Tax=Gracilibacillus suaedae TaxID=2820273 RepID=UPI001ABEE541|nr:Ger(x)C family spore germination protein [Gracilibacillus suaedae]